MSFEKLPNEIIDYILSKISIVSDVLDFSAVCRRFHYLAHARFSQVNYLIYISPDEDDISINHRDALFYHTADRKRLMTFVQNLPNLKVLEIGDACGPAAFILRDIFTCRSDVIGVWFNFPLPSPLNRFAVSTATIESIKSGTIENAYYQLIVETASRELWMVLPQMDKIKRLHIEYYRADTMIGYTGGPFSSIEMLEMAVLGLSDFCNHHYVVLIDNCPSLKSLFLSFAHCKSFPLVFPPQNCDLENLVLEYDENSHQSWSSLGSFLYKYPNLKCIAIRGNLSFNDYHVRQLLHYWKKLQLIDVRGCNITENAAKFVAKFNDDHTKVPSVKFVYGPLTESYHDRINYRPNCKGIDFMANIFNKSFANVPLFLEPIQKDQINAEMEIEKSTTIE